MSVVTEHPLAELFSENEKLDVKMHRKLAEMFKYLTQIEAQEHIFIRPHSWLTEALMRVVGAKQLNDDGVFTLFNNRTQQKWATLDYVCAFERSGFAVDYLATVFVLGELGRQAESVANTLYTTPRRPDFFNEIVEKVGKNIIAAAHTLLENQKPVTLINAEVFKAHLIEEITPLLEPQNYAAYKLLFNDGAQYVLPLVRYAYEVADETLTELKKHH